MIPRENPKRDGRVCRQHRWVAASPELQNRKPGSDRTDYRKSAKPKHPRNHKGFLNRRFKRVFAYFCRGAKVGAESGAAQVPGRFEKKFPPRPKGAEKEL